MDKIFADEVVAGLVSVQDMMRWTVSRFHAANIHYGHGTDNAWDEASHLILPTLYLPLDVPSEIYASRLVESERRIIVERVMRRINERIPTAYLTNTAWFCGHELYVDERVLIPRSPIGELILNHFLPLLTNEPQHILDMCTGSGCIALACGYEFPNAKVDAVDISQDALVVAERNISAHNLAEQITLIRSDLWQDMPMKQYDLIVTNPPYVDAEDMASLPDEYHREPEVGLAAGSDGLKLVRRLLARAAEFLTTEGVFICEVGNSATHLLEAYPHIPFVWLEFQHGGDGVFMLTREQLLACKDEFQLYQ